MKIADRQRLCSMIKGFFVLLLMAFLAACGGGQVIPDWTVTAYNRLEDFKKAYLEGDVRIADLHFRKAVEEIKKSGDGEILAKAYLTRMAVERAALDTVGEEGFLKADAVTSSAENRSFYNLLRGRFDVVQADVLPPQYRNLYALLTPRGPQGSLVKAVGGIEDPLSRLVACGIIVHVGRGDEELLQAAIATASRQGWKRALVAYLERLRVYYLDKGMTTHAEGVSRRLALIR